MTDATTSSLPTIRYRSATGLRSLDPNSAPETLFAAQEARLDQILLKGHGDVILDGDASFQAVAEAIDASATTELLSVTPGRGAQWRVNSPSDRWLFTFSGLLTPRPQANRFHLKFDLWLNPTRFVAHRGPRSSDWPAADIDLLSWSPAAAAERRQITLDGNDNVLLGREQLGGSLFSNRRVQARAVLHAYFAAVWRSLTAALSPSGMATFHRTELTLNRVETYWELDSPDAVTAVAELTERLRRSDNAVRALTRPLTDGATGNAHWCRLPLTNDIDLTLYAKLANRVRVELVHHDRIHQALRRGHVPLSMSLPDRIVYLARDAHDRLLQAWSPLMSSLTNPSETASIFDFMAKLNGAVPEANRRLLLALLGNRRIISSTGDTGVAPTAVCRALVRSGVLERTGVRNRSGQYRLTPAYSAMFDLLACPGDAAGAC